MRGLGRFQDGTWGCRHCCIRHGLIAASYTPVLITAEGMPACFIYLPLQGLWAALGIQIVTFPPSMDTSFLWWAVLACWGSEG